MIPTIQNFILSSLGVRRDKHGKIRIRKQVQVNGKNVSQECLTNRFCNNHGYYNFNLFEDFEKNLLTYEPKDFNDN